jgi:hypothetical protein
MAVERNPRSLSDKCDPILFTTRISLTMVQPMISPTRPPRTRQDLTAELANIRRESMKATERGDFRTVARLTLEAARINRAIKEILPPETSP